MIMSMTGYGSGTASNESVQITAEVRSVNNRYLDVSLKLPKLLSVFEQQVRELVGNRVARGRINVWLSVKTNIDVPHNLSVNHSIIDAYLKVTSEIAQRHGIEGKITLEQLLALPDVIGVETEEVADDAMWEVTKGALEQALDQLVIMRKREGQEMEKDFIARINALYDLSEKVEQYAKQGPELELNKLKERVKRFLDHEKVDEYRLEMELALISDRIDISEECTRFKSHITLFRELLASETSQGRKLNFLLQEMNREANTMASKAFTAEISHIVVKMKEEIEKVREQVQNIE